MTGLGITVELPRGVTTSPIVVQLKRASDYGGYVDAVNVFTGEEALEFVVWEGDDRAALDVEFPVAWEDAEAGQVRVEFPRDAVDDLDPGVYQARIQLVANSDHLQQLILRVSDGPGIATARPSYITLRDLENELPWIQDLFASGIDQASFAEILAESKEWVDRIILGRHRPYPRGVQSYEWGWDWDFSGGRGDSLHIRAALADGKLMLDTPHGWAIKKSCVYYALAQILRRCVGRAVESGLLGLSDDYEVKANAKIVTCSAELDTDDDGVANHIISLRTTRTRYGR